MIKKNTNNTNNDNNTNHAKNDKIRPMPEVAAWEPGGILKKIID